MQTAMSSTQATTSKTMVDSMISEGSWRVVDEYFKPNKGTQLIKHQIESFNDFVLRKVGQIIEGFNPIDINHNYMPESDSFKHMISIHVENPTLVKPLIYEKDGSTKSMTPNDARLRNFTYSSAMSVNLIITTKSMGEDGEYSVETKKINNVSLGKLPIMVRSNYCILKNECVEVNECQYDYGGYFIINGNEKVIISQDRISENKTFVFVSNKVSPYSHIAEIRSVQENKLSVPKITTLKLSSKPNQFGRCIRVNIHHIKIDISVFILFKAFGLANDKEIIQYIVYDLRSEVGQLVASQLMACVEEGSTVLCQRDAIEYLSKYLNISGYPKEYLQNKANRLALVRQVLEKEVLPHVGKDLKKKALYLGFMVRKLMKCFLGICEFDDRDSYINKRVDTPGVLLASIFRQYYGKMVKDLKNMVQKEINTGGWKVSNKLINVINKVNVYKIVKSTTIDSGLKYALSTGNWGIKSNKNKQGVAQVLNRMTYNATLSHLRRVNTPIEKSGKLIQPRKLHATQWGIICPAETPEGAGVGLVKNMAVMANITICSNSTNVREIVEEQLGVISFGEKTGYDVEMFTHYTHVLINGDIVGIHHHPEELYNKLKDMKRCGAINVYTSVVWNIQNNEISISTEGGRCVRPLFIVEDNKCRLTEDVIKKLKEGQLSWIELICGNDDIPSVVEYMDVEETNSALIAMNHQDLLEGKTKCKRYTHMEIHPSLIMGLVASCIPFSDHNQAPRVAYQCLWKEENVLMFDGQHKKIKDVKIGDEVITFDPITFKASPSKVVNHFVKATEKVIHNVTTWSERSIIATYDHPFMTTEGWKKVEDFNEDTFVGIHFTTKYLPNICEEKQILSQEQFITTLQAYNVSETLIQKHVKTLVENNLLPLMNSSPHLPTIARICGVVSTDGSLNVYDKKTYGFKPQCSGNFGCIEDAMEFEKDVETMGFKSVNITFRDGKEYGATYMVTHNGALPSLLIALGMTLGNHVNVERLPIPDWIMNGSSFIKREFISAFQGGDGCKIRWNKTNHGHNFICALTSQQINFDYKNSLKRFMQQMVSLIRDLDIEVSNPIITQIGNDRVQVGYKIRDTHDNLINYFETIGYTYSSFKNVESGVVVEYLKYKNVFVANHKMKMQEIRDLFDNGLSVPEIAKQTRIPYTIVADHVRYYKRGAEIRCKFTKEQQIEAFLEKVKIINSTMFVKVKSKDIIDNVEIADITVETDNHSFIAGNGFMVHNSSMAKQAIGVYTSNYRYRYDTMGHVLNYGQKPIVKTNPSVIVNNDNLPSGINAIVAIATYTGFNQEDSVILNKSAVDRGLFTSTYYRTYKELNNKNHSNGEEEFFTKPDTTVVRNIKPYNYSKLDNTGFVPENTPVQGGDVIIGKVMPTKVNNIIHYKDNSMALKPTDNGVVDRNGANDKYFTNTNGDGYNFAKVRLRSERVPTIGDKFCLPPKAEVLCLDGWKPINTITCTDLVAQLNNSTLEYVHPVNTYEFAHCGDMLQISSRHVDLITTLEHKMYIRHENHTHYQLIEAKHIIGETVYFKKNCLPYKQHSIIDAIDIQQSALERGISVDIVNGKFRHNQNHDNEPIVKPSDYNIIHYTGKVYCIEVPSHIFYVRMNGKPVWTGNSSRHGQKGTCGILYRQEDMPFTADGLVPDIIMNPHAIPSRMTIGQLMECIMGKACTQLGTYGYATPFNGVTVDELADILENQCGMERHGNQILYNSRTGEQIHTDIFIGPTFYQRLKHMTIDKIHGRGGNGPIVLMTHQPSDGRSRDGGLRLGEMEIECNWAHGIMQFLKERLMECSDNYRVFVCKKCGLMSNVTPEKNIYQCRNCKNITHFSEVRMPYCMKLLTQEVQTMGIGARFMT